MLCAVNIIKTPQLQKSEKILKIELEITATQLQAMPVPLAYKPFPPLLSYSPAGFILMNKLRPISSLPVPDNSLFKNTKWGAMLRGQAKVNWEEHEEPESEQP